MKVTFIASSLWLSGGVLEVVGYAVQLARRGHQVAIVTPRGSVDDEVGERLGPSVHVIQVGRGLSYAQRYQDMLGLTLQLALSVPPSDVVVATHTPTTPAALLASWRRRARPVWFYQDYLEMFTGRPLVQFLLKSLPGWFAHVMAVSTSAADEVRRFGARGVTTVHVGIPEHELFYPPPSHEARERGVLLTLGDMRPRKGMFDVLEAVKVLTARGHALRLVLFAKEPCDVKTPVPVELYYRPTRAQLADLYRRCAVFVSASWWESIGLPPLEAMACGTPVVLTKSRGASDYARSGENCLLIAPRQPAALAQAIEQVLLDPALARRLGEAGPATSQDYNWEHCTDLFEAALRA